MEEDNRKGPGIFYAVVGVATLVVAIIGATFAYFSAAANDDASTIKGQTANVGSSVLTLSVTKVTKAGAGDLIPLKEADQMSKALTADCKDEKDYTVCQVYKIEVSNSGTVDATMTGTLKLESSASNMKWKRISTQDTEGEVDTASTAQSVGSAQAFVNDVKVTASGGSETYYVVVWLEESDNDQTATDAGQEFTGTVSFSAAGGGHLTATFS